MNRYMSLLGPNAKGPQAATGWQLTHLVPPSGLFGANGMQFGPDGRLYVAQAFGSQVSALDISSGSCETISPVGGPIVAPDDLAFDSHGAMYATEVMSARVCARTPNGDTRIVNEDLPGANGVTVYQDRVFMDECRPGGRLFELYPQSGQAPRLIAGNLPLPNALMVGPDNQIYFPEVVAGEVWRVAIEGGTPERVATGLATPVAVKFNRQGELVVPQAGSGEIVRIDVQSGAKTVLAKIRPGIDNLAFSPDNRLFISHFIDGGVAEVATDGSNAERVLVAAGLIGPWGLACGTDGMLYAADGMSVAVISATGTVTRLGMLLEEGSPGFLRGLAAGASGELYVTTSGGGVASYHPVSHASAVLANELNELYGLACTADGTLIVAEGGGGRILGINPATKEVSVLASGLSHPTGIVAGSDGSCCVSETGKGRVVRIDSSGTITPMVEGLKEPQGLAVRGDELLILDCGTKELHAVSLATGQRQIIASNLAVGAPPGIEPKPLMGVPVLLPGPLSTFADLATGADGTIYIAGDGEGSVIVLRQA